MRVWEFRDLNNYKWLLTEQDNKELLLEVATFSNRYKDWGMIDEMQKDGKLKFIKEYNLGGKENE